MHTLLVHLFLDGSAVLLLYIAGCAASLPDHSDRSGRELGAVTDPGREAIQAACALARTVPVPPPLDELVDEPTGGRHRKPPAPPYVAYPADLKGDAA